MTRYPITAFPTESLNEEIGNSPKKSDVYNGLLNGDFENWIDPTTPEYWVVDEYSTIDRENAPTYLIKGQYSARLNNKTIGYLSLLTDEIAFSIYIYDDSLLWDVTIELVPQFNGVPFETDSLNLSTTANFGWQYLTTTWILPEPGDSSSYLRIYQNGTFSNTDYCYLDAGVIYNFDYPLSLENDVDLDIFCSGNSTTGLNWDDARVLEDYVFIGDGTGTAMEIQNTREYLIIRNCTIKGFDKGIYLSNNYYVRIENTTITECFWGIDIRDNYESFVENNTCSDNSFGVYLSNCQEMILENNTCNMNAQTGIFVRGSNTIELHRNNCSENGYGGFYIIDCSNFIGSNNTSNKNGERGLFISNSDHMNFNDEKFLQNKYGVFIEWSYVIQFDFCQGHRNTLYGWYARNSDHIYIYNCSSKLNEGTGICLEDTDGSQIKMCEATENTYFGIQGQYSNYLQLWTNNCSNNYFGGIQVYTAVYDSIRYNLCNNNQGTGIEFSSLSYSDAINNTNIGNLKNGIKLINSNSIIIKANNCTDNDQAGFFYSYSNYITSTDNTAMRNANGTILQNCDLNRLENHTCQWNTQYGLIINNTMGLKLTTNTINSNGILDFLNQTQGCITCQICEVCEPCEACDGCDNCTCTSQTTQNGSTSTSTTTDGSSPPISFSLSEIGIILAAAGAAMAIGIILTKKKLK